MIKNFENFINEGIINSEIKYINSLGKIKSVNYKNGIFELITKKNFKLSFICPGENIIVNGEEKVIENSLDIIDTDIISLKMENDYTIELIFSNGNIVTLIDPTGGNGIHYTAMSLRSTK